MIEFLIDVIVQMNNYEFFFYVPCTALVFGVCMLIVNFNKKGDYRS